MKLIAVTETDYISLLNILFDYHFNANIILYPTVAALKLNTNLRELYLGDNKICSADGVQIGNLLRANACLDILDLRKNHIQDIGSDHICEGLVHQPYGGLKILNMSDNQLTSRAMSHLSQCLVSGHYLSIVFNIYPILRMQAHVLISRGQE